MSNELIMRFNYRVEIGQMCIFKITNHLIFVDKDNICRIDKPERRRIDDQYAFKVKYWKQTAPAPVTGK